MNKYKGFIQASLILIIGSLTAAISHLFAHQEADIRFTLVGFLVAITSGIYYGLKVPSSLTTSKSNKILSLEY